MMIFVLINVEHSGEHKNVVRYPYIY